MQQEQRHPAVGFEAARIMRVSARSARSTALRQHASCGCLREEASERASTTRPRSSAIACTKAQVSRV